MDQEMKNLVRMGYESGQYEKTYRQSSAPNPFEKDLLDTVLGPSPTGIVVLDLGCGTGIPYDQYMVDKGVLLYGVDFCLRHLKLANQSVPQAHYFMDDISEMRFPPGTFDLITSFYTIFHLPRDEHNLIFSRMYSWLKDGGRLLVTLGTSDLAYGEEENWIGEDRMAWSSYPPEKYKGMVREIGFSWIDGKYEGAPGDDEYHYWMMCEKGTVL